MIIVMVFLDCMDHSIHGWPDSLIQFFYKKAISTMDAIIDTISVITHFIQLLISLLETNEIVD